MLRATTAYGLALEKSPLIVEIGLLDVSGPDLVKSNQDFFAV